MELSTKAREELKKVLQKEIGSFAVLKMTDADLDRIGLFFLEALKQASLFEN